jgi:hypothetical protein
MSLIPCSFCGLRVPGKLSSTTWAWYRADGVRVAYRQRLCLACFASNVVPLEVETRDFSLSCPMCHTDASGDLDAVYATIFVPGMGKITLELPTDPKCAAELRARAQRGAEALESSVFGGLGPGPQTGTPDSAWGQLGIQPR